MRFYAESDGDPGRKVYYVVDSHADPGGEQRTTHCPNMPKAYAMAQRYNLRPPWPSWDMIQAALDKILSID